MAKNKAFSQIRTYEELEAALQQVHYETEINPFVEGVSHLKAGTPTGNVWADLLVVAIRAVRSLLAK